MNAPPLWKTDRFCPSFTRLICTTAVVGIVLSVLAEPSDAQTGPDDPSQGDPLATKQQIIRDRVLRLEDQVFRLIETLKDEDAEQARRLEELLEKMGELGVRSDLQELIEIISEGSLEVAVDRQRQLLADLNDLLRILVEEKLDEDTRERTEQLEKALEQLDQIAGEQRKLAEASEAASQQAQGQKDAEAVAAIESLIGRQKELMQSTAARGEGRSDTDEESLATLQRELAEQAEQLAKMLRDEKQEPEAAKSADAAQRAMADATGALEEKRHGLATDAQDEAIDHLQRTLERLTKRPLEQPDDRELSELAREQEEVQEQTRQLAQQMQGDPENQNDLPVPGEQNVSQAGQNMENAAQDLQQSDASQASDQQQQALQELEKARAQIQQELDRLKSMQQQQKLDELKQNFEKMLTEQRAINRATRELDHIGKEKWKRTHYFKSIEQSKAERELAELADQSLKLLLDDGTTAVLPHLVEYLRDDLSTASDRLGDAKVGPVTQTLQVDIVHTLEDILDAVEQEQLAAQGRNQQQQPGQPGEPQLLPTTAELQLLANLQKRLLSQTRRGHRTEPVDADKVLRLAEKQKDLAAMAVEMNNKLNRRQQPDHQN